MGFPTWLTIDTSTDATAHTYSIGTASSSLTAGMSTTNIGTIIGTHEIYIKYDNLPSGSNIYYDTTGTVVGTDGYVIQTFTILCAVGLSSNDISTNEASDRSFTADALTTNVYYTGSDYFKVTFSDPEYKDITCGKTPTVISLYHVTLEPAVAVEYFSAKYPNTDNPTTYGENLYTSLSY